ncbi:probable pyridoxal 5'-phosphate synthase subunit Sno3p [[Candida] railenensis]|uniref:glutaminase n=1 Tax=[Candida] railenensis TaxID=45579 RepID=A0A9P0QT57_9ASCO|nr:probable pyridoxal 5'-phosphate synthase subunit Sno3p [[Candida] railenensis]
MTRSLVVGVLALQGAFIEHIQIFEKIQSPVSYSFIEVRTEEQLHSCDALVIPGGESTAISLIAQRTSMLKPLMDFIKSEKPVWGTCAGLIFLSKQIVNGREGQKILGGMDIMVKRNAFGRQLNSFEQKLDFSTFIPGVSDFPTVFIRAPVVEMILDDSEETYNKLGEVIRSENTYQNPSKVEILHQLENGLIVAVRQGNKIGTSFHPELSDDTRFHKWFLDEFVSGK